jgi:hypothetical protein
MDNSNGACSLQAPGPAEVEVGRKEVLRAYRMLQSQIAFEPACLFLPANVIVMLTGIRAGTIDCSQESASSDRHIYISSHIPSFSLASLAPNLTLDRRRPHEQGSFSNGMRLIKKA